MTNQHALKRCPFCGHTAEVHGEDGDQKRWLQVVCGGCGAKGPERMAGYPNDAVDGWNRRSSHPDAHEPTAGNCIANPGWTCPKCGLTEAGHIQRECDWQPSEFAQGPSGNRPEGTK